MTARAWEQVTLTVIVRLPVDASESYETLAEGVAESIIDGWGCWPGWTAKATVVKSERCSPPEP